MVVKIMRALRILTNTTLSEGPMDLAAPSLSTLAIILAVTPPVNSVRGPRYSLRSRLLIEGNSGFYLPRQRRTFLCKCERW